MERLEIHYTNGTPTGGIYEGNVFEFDGQRPIHGERAITGWIGSIEILYIGPHLIIVAHPTDLQTFKVKLEDHAVLDGRVQATVG